MTLVKKALDAARAEFKKAAAEKDAAYDVAIAAEKAYRVAEAAVEAAEEKYRDAYNAESKAYSAYYKAGENHEWNNSERAAKSWWL